MEEGSNVGQEKPSDYNIDLASVKRKEEKTEAGKAMQAVVQLWSCQSAEKIRNKDHLIEESCIGQK